MIIRGWRRYARALPGKDLKTELFVAKHQGSCGRVVAYPMDFALTLSSPFRGASASG